MRVTDGIYLGVMLMATVLCCEGENTTLHVYSVRYNMVASAGSRLSSCAPMRRSKTRDMTATNHFNPHTFTHSHTRALTCVWRYKSASDVTTAA